MGHSLNKDELRIHLKNKVTIDDFIFLYVIGKGTYGKIWKVKHKLSDQYYALKQMTKVKIIEESSEMSTLKSRVFLAQMKSPFIVKMFLSFQNKFNLFLMMELLSGGDLQYHYLNYTFLFKEVELKFLLSNIILGLKYIHSKNIVHRNIKPENIIFDSQGYLKITGFSNSSYINKIDIKNDKGTPAYMSLERLQGEKQDFSIDYYSLGVIAYELIMRKLPYDENNREKIIKLMKNNIIDLKKEKSLKEKYSDDCLDFINKLLLKNPEEILGNKNEEKDIKNHKFFIDWNWDLIQKRKFYSPMLDVIRYSKLNHGNVQELFDYDYCNKNDDIRNTKIDKYIYIINKNNYTKYFRFYDIICEENIMKEFYQVKKRINDENKKLKRNLSLKELNNYQGIDNYKYNFPYINNSPMDIYHHNQLKNYYEQKLFRYKKRLNKLKKSINLNNSKNKFGNGIFSNLDKTYESIYFPMMNINNNPFMKKIVRKFIDKMSEDRNNFFIKIKNKSHSKKKGKFKFDLNHYSIDQENEGFKYNYYNSPLHIQSFYPNINKDS